MKSLVLLIVAWCVVGLALVTYDHLASGRDVRVKDLPALMTKAPLGPLALGTTRDTILIRSWK